MRRALAGRADGRKAVNEQVAEKWQGAGHKGLEWCVATEISLADALYLGIALRGRRMHARIIFSLQIIRSKLATGDMWCLEARREDINGFLG